MIYGKGVMDLNIDLKEGYGKLLYKTWYNMFYRCYSSKYHERHPTYIGSEVDPRWWLLSSFKEWFDENYVEKWNLDKDLALEGNKVYSPETCNYVPSQLNTLFLHKNGSRGVREDYPTGVSKSVSKVTGKVSYLAHMRVKGKSKHLGTFDSVLGAKDFYDISRKSYVIYELENYKQLYKDNKNLVKLLNILLDKEK